MPELPEVETIRKQLDKALAGQKIVKIEKLHPKSLQSASRRIRAVGRKITGVKRRAKTIWFDLEGDCNLLVHLKMTGQLLINGQQGKHTRVIIHLSKDKVIFNDLRIFGWIKVVGNVELQKHFAKLPPDVVDKTFTLQYLEKILKKSRRPVKLVIMDQQKLGGVGNIYANDGLYCAKINPRTPANKVTRIKELHRCLKEVIERGIKLGGSTAKDENYVDAYGKIGKYQTKFLVYEQAGKKCRRCKSEIKKIKLGGRGTYFCPQCQS